MNPPNSSILRWRRTSRTGRHPGLGNGLVHESGFRVPQQLSIGTLSAEGLNGLFPSVAGRHDQNQFAVPLARGDFFNGINPTRTFNDHSRSTVKRSGSPPKYLCKASLNT